MNSKEYREFLETYNGIYEEVGVKTNDPEKTLQKMVDRQGLGGKVVPSSSKLQKAHYEPEGEEYLDEAPLNYGDPVAAKWNKQLADFNVKGRGREMTPPSIPKGYAYNAQAGTITKGGVAPIPATARTRPAAPAQQNLRGLSVGPGGFNINNRPVQTTRPAASAPATRPVQTTRPASPAPATRPAATAPRPAALATAPRPATSAPTTRPATPTTTTTTVTPKKPSITSDIKDLQKLRMASQMRQAGANVVSTQLASFDLFDVIKGYLLDEGFADTEESALAIMTNMSEEWRQSILEMSNFEAGGGNAKMKKSGMSRAEVEALGKKNLEKSKKSSTTNSDSDKESRREFERKAMAAGKSPVGYQRMLDAQERERKYNEWEKRRPKPSGGYRGLAGS